MCVSVCACVCVCVCVYIYIYIYIYIWESGVNAFLVLDHALDLVDGVGILDIEGDGLTWGKNKAMSGVPKNIFTQALAHEQSALFPNFGADRSKGKSNRGGLDQD